MGSKLPRPKLSLIINSSPGASRRKASKSKDSRTSPASTDPYSILTPGFDEFVSNGLTLQEGGGGALRLDGADLYHSIQVRILGHDICVGLWRRSRGWGRHRSCRLLAGCGLSALLIAERLRMHGSYGRGRGRRRRRVLSFASGSGCRRRALLRRVTLRGRSACKGFIFQDFADA
jgi:hypothetical protein